MAQRRRRGGPATPRRRAGTLDFALQQANIRSTRRRRAGNGQGGATTGPAMRVAWLIAATIVLGAAGAGYYFLHAREDAAGPTRAAGGPPGGFAVPVEAVPARLGSLTRTIDAIGTLRSDESIVIRPEVAGRIARIQFAEGSRVDKGAVLVELDASVARAQLAQARASLVLSRANLERAQELFGRGAMSGRARDEAVSKLRSDEAAVALAEAVLEKMTLVAPFPGLVGLRKVSVGDFVAVGQEIANLEKIMPMKVDFRVPEIYLGAVSTGQAIEVQVDAFPDRKFGGTVYAIDPLVDERGRSIVIRARVPNEDAALRPGVFARVKLIVTERNDALLVPEEAVVPMGAERVVYRVIDGKAVGARIRIGARRGGAVQVLDGLSPGDMVVTAGQLKLRDGAPVTVVPAGGQGARAPAAAEGAGGAPGGR
jgi:membrane fusion protein (multidrug efflux system)